MLESNRFSPEVTFTGRTYTAMIKSHGLQHAFITPYSAEQNGVVELAIRTLRDQFVNVIDSRASSTPVVSSMTGSASTTTSAVTRHRTWEPCRGISLISLSGAETAGPIHNQASICKG